MSLAIFIAAGCLTSAAVASAVTYYAVNWSRDRQAENDNARRELAIEHGLRLAQENQQLEQQVSGEQPRVDLYDQDADPWDFIGIRSEGSPPIRMTGERDTDAQDRELSEVFHIAPDGYCPVEGHHTTVGRRAYMDWLTWCSCGWEAESTNQAEANELYAQHQAQISGGGCPWAECPHPDRCDTGCRWGEEANQWADLIHVEDDGPETLPRVLPEGRISD